MHRTGGGKGRGEGPPGDAGRRPLGLEENGERANPMTRIRPVLREPSSTGPSEHPPPTGARPGHLSITGSLGAIIRDRDTTPRLRLRERRRRALLLPTPPLRSLPHGPPLRAPASQSCRVSTTPVSPDQPEQSQMSREPCCTRRVRLSDVHRTIFAASVNTSHPPDTTSFFRGLLCFISVR